jgi:hypothetical protein
MPRECCEQAPVPTVLISEDINIARTTSARKAIDCFRLHVTMDALSGSIYQTSEDHGRTGLCSNSGDQAGLLSFREAQVESICTGQLQRVTSVSLISVGQLVIEFAISTCTLMNRTSACTTQTTPALLTARPVPTLVRLISRQELHHCPAMAVLVAFLAQRKVADRVDVSGSGARGGSNRNTNRWT